MMGGLPQRIITFDAYADETFLHPVIGILLLVLCVFALCAKRRYSLIPILIALNFVTWAQRVTFLGLDFTVLRILICVTILRIILRKEYCWFQPTKLDKTVIFYAVVSTVAYSMQSPTIGAFTNSLGSALDILGAYSVVRILIRDNEDLKTNVIFLMYTCIIMAGLFLAEKIRDRNLFSAFGGVPAIPDTREGRMRIQGPYPHAILAGTYWAAVFPLFMGYVIENGRINRKMLISAACCVVIVYLCASSTPVMSLAFALIACLLYYQRDALRFIKVASLVALVGLAVVMDHPIWFLFTKIDVAGGSTGYHRYLLIDQFMRNWREWIAIGVPDTFHWGQNLLMGAPGLGLADVTNQFVAEAVRGGLLSLVLFIAAFVIALGYTGRMMDEAANPDERRQVWHVGVSLAVHAVSFMGVSYFGQLPFMWWMSLAICGSLFQKRKISCNEESSVEAMMNNEPLPP